MDYNDIPSYSTPLELLNSGEVVKVCAPMVRYSGLAFRTLVRRYNCDLAFTPMIVAESFVQSPKARGNDFVTNSYDRPLIVQFAANNAQVFADAADLVSESSDGVDLNCGCPQRWAMQEGYGACLLKKPEILSDMITAANDRVSNRNFTVSIKIRIHDDIRRSVDLCQKAVMAGAAWITVHGRTTEQRGQPVNIEAIKTIKDCVSVPVIANGDIRTLAEARLVHEKTKVNGVMAARGILSNPAMYEGFDNTPLKCLSDWVRISLAYGSSFQQFHNHLIYMMENVTSRPEKRIFNSLSSTSAVIDYLEENYGIDCSSDRRSDEAPAEEDKYF